MRTYCPVQDWGSIGVQGQRQGSKVSLRGLRRYLLHIVTLLVCLFFLFLYLDLMSRISVIWISSPELSYVCHTYTMPVLLCGPKIYNKDSCILYFSCSILNDSINTYNVSQQEILVNYSLKEEMHVSQKLYVGIIIDQALS